MKLVINHLALLDALLGFIHHGLDAKLVGVLLFLESPILVVIIKAVLIEVNLFINLELLDHHTLAAEACEVHERAAKHQVETVSKEEN
jgi:hypothetical protein